MRLTPGHTGLASAPTLTTERLILRAHDLDDFHRLVLLYRTERSRHIGGPLAEKAVWRDFMNAVGHWPILGFGAWGVNLRATGECIGQVAVTFPAEYPEPELGWLLFENHEGKGYAFEAAGRAKRFAFEEAGLDKLVSYIDPQNFRSIRLAGRLGGLRDPGAPTPGGDPCLVYRYAPP
jgi:RimJ/RimL family protein N-acetyltransferase